MNYNKDLLDLLQESVQAWDKNSKKIFFNKKSNLLYDVTDEEIETFDDITSKWVFFDSKDEIIEPNDLPINKVVHSREPIKDVVLKIVSEKTTKWIVQSVNPINDANREFEGVVSTCTDITNIKSQETKYKNIANYDPLTKLPNRLLLSDRLSFAISHAKRSKKLVAVCMIDLDGFKAVNDTLGHDAGDALLIEVSKRMQKVVRIDDTVARLGGDEFVIILTDIEKNDDCAVTLYRLLNALSLPYVINDKEVNTVSASIGVSLYPDDKVDPDILLRHADVAMYKAKNSGKNRFCFFDISSDKKIKANFRTLEKIRKAIVNGEFCFYYQPKINTSSGNIIEVEALARWIHPLLGLMRPDEFLPLIENDNELSNEFDEWAIKEGILQLHAWQQEGLYVKVCVNISPKQLKQDDFVSKVKEIILQNNLDIELLSYLEFEILETAAVEHLSNSNDVIVQCRELGISFALDDFGTGHSSLIHLKELAIDTVKIDKSFVMGMLDSSENMAIVQAVTGLASAFDISVTAEGAENIEQVLSLIEIGCDEIQGYSIARPMPKDDMKDFIFKFIPDPRWKLASQKLPSKSDFELLLAETNHKYWVEQVIDELSKEVSNDELFQTSHEDCKFGRWLEKIKNKNNKIISNKKNLEFIHQQMHEKVYNLYEELKKEKRVINSEEKDQVFQMSYELIILIESIKRDYEQENKHISLANKILNKRKNNGR
ncbi:EAL domain-containing protein [Sulfurimonas sp.]